jgi:iron complex outermembrane receptor protein
MTSNISKIIRNTHRSSLFSSLCGMASRQLKGLAILVFLPFSMLAFSAENTPAAEAAVPVKRNSNAIEEVFVTATKREKSVRDIPTSIDAMTGSRLEEMGAIGLEEALKFSPGVTLQKGSNPDQNNVSFRGIGGASKFGSRSFGIFYEDVPLVNPAKAAPQPNLDPFDLSTVEILKGPQGTLFGGSALAGAIRYMPNNPDYEAMYGSFSVGHTKIAHSADSGSRNTVMVNLPFSDRFALRASGVKTDDPGYMNRPRTGEEDVNSVEIAQNRLLLSARSENDNFQAKLTYLEREVESAGNSRANNQYRYEQSAYWGPEDSGSDIVIEGLSLQWQGFEAMSLSLIGNKLTKEGFLNHDLTESTDKENDAKVTYAKIEYDTEQTTYELRMVSNGVTEHDWFIFRDWEYVAGFFEMEADQDFYVLVALAELDPIAATGLPMALPIGDQGAYVVAPVTALTKEKAFYFDTTRYLFDNRMEINIGGRSYETSTDGKILQQAMVQGGKATLVDVDAEIEESGFSPKLALTWRFTPDLSVHTSASKGFRFGGVQGDAAPVRNEVPPTFDSDELWNYEVGVRSSWLDHSLQIDLTAFYIDWIEPQTALQTTPSTVPLLYPDTEFIANVDSAEAKGGEASLIYAMPMGLTLMANLGYVDSYTTENFSAPEGEIPAYSRLPNTPRWTGAAIVSYRTMLANWGLSANLSYTYQGESKNDFFNTVPLDSFDSMGLSLNINNESLPMRPELVFSVTNLRDERSILAANSDGDPGEDEDIDVYFVSPRTFTANLRLHF